MHIQRLVVSSLFVLAACGGGKKKPPAEPAQPAAAPASDTAAAAAPAPAPAPEPAAAPAPPPPPPPRRALGDAKIVMKAKKKTQTLEAEIVLAADGTVTANVTEATGKKKDKKTKTGKLTADGQMIDDQGEVMAKLGDGGTVS